MATYSGIVYGLSSRQDLYNSGVRPEGTPFQGWGMFGSTYHSGVNSFWTYVFFPQLDDPVWEERNITAVSCDLDVASWGGASAAKFLDKRLDFRENVSGEFKIWDDRSGMPRHDDWSYEPYETNFPALAYSQAQDLDRYTEIVKFDESSGLLNIVNRWVNGTTDYRYGACIFIDDGERDGNGNPLIPQLGSPNVYSGTFPEISTFYNISISGVILNITWADVVAGGGSYRRRIHATHNNFRLLRRI